MYRALFGISAGLIVLGLALMLGYEAIAIINLHIPFTKNLPLITDIVRPWAMAHKMLFLAIAAIVLADLFWLFWHFVLPA